MGKVQIWGARLSDKPVKVIASSTSEFKKTHLRRGDAWENWPDLYLKTISVISMNIQNASVARIILHNPLILVEKLSQLCPRAPDCSSHMWTHAVSSPVCLLCKAKTFSCCRDHRSQPNYQQYTPWYYLGLCQVGKRVGYASPKPHKEEQENGLRQYSHQGTAMFVLFQDTSRYPFMCISDAIQSLDQLTIDVKLMSLITANHSKP